MKDEQIQSLFIIAWHLNSFIGGVIGLIGGAYWAGLICFIPGLILPTLLVFNYVDDEFKNAKW